MEKEDYIKLIACELSILNKRHAAWCINRIDLYNSSVTWDFYVNNYTPREAAEQIMIWFKEEDDKKKIEEEEQDKERRERRNKRMEEAHERFINKPYVAPNQSLEFQLGCYIGDHIVSKYLPTLSIDSMTNKTVEVSKEDEIEYNKLNNTWFDTKDETNEKNENWIKYLSFRKYLTIKYLPPVLECYVNRLTSVNDMKKLKEGIRCSLYNCDCCSYKAEIDDIVIDNEEDQFFTKIILQLDKS